jgi:type II secretory pathway component PulK
MTTLKSVPTRPIRRRATVLLVVLWAIAIAIIIVATLQASSLSQASAGRESLARVRAYWAARAGVEAAIARLEEDSLSPDPDDAFRIYDDLASAAQASLANASYRVSHSGPRGEVLGPEDAHAKLNINRLNFQQLMNLEPYMTEDVAAGILDWIDPDEEPQPIVGAEITAYQTLTFKYQPRNAPMRSIQELELILNADAKDVRGEDWNLNAFLDPNEDDGDASFPPDNRDGKLDANWSAILTAASLEGGLTISGQEPLDLSTASDRDLISRTAVDSDQAKAILDYVAANSAARLSDFIRRDLSQLAQQSSGGGGGGGANRQRVENLSDDQLEKLLAECFIPLPVPIFPVPGKLNINTCEPEVLQMLPDIDPAVADAIVSERAGKSKGFTSVLELRDISGVGRRTLANLFDLLTTRSNVFVVRSRGRDAKSAIEVEIVATIDRSTIPATIREVRIQ